MRRLVLLCLVPCLASCAGTQDAGVSATAERFYASVDEGDGEGACALLAPRTRDELEQSAGKPCPQAVVEEDLEVPSAVEDVQAFGTAAQVRWTDETMFLTRFGDAWRVVAAGCAPVPGDRYDCTVEAG
jgi:hypothetical protein